jgi:hypothetical protein
MQENNSRTASSSQELPELDIRRWPWLWPLVIWVPCILGLLTLAILMVLPKPEYIDPELNKALLGVWEGRYSSGVIVRLAFEEHNRFHFWSEPAQVRFGGRGDYGSHGHRITLTQDPGTDGYQIWGAYFAAINDDVLSLQFDSGRDFLHTGVLRRVTPR